MNSRRDLLATLGVVALAGCTAESSEQGNSQPENTDNSNTPERELSIPFGGLGAYEDAVNNADSIDEANGVTAGQIHDILEQSDTVQEEADELSNLGTTNNIHSILQEYHLEKNEGDNMVVANINWSFTSDSEPIIEYHTVENGQLQGNPIITDPNHELKKHKPGQKEPQYLKDLRDSSDWAQIVPQDYDAFEDRINPLEEQEKREARNWFFTKWSNTMFGTESEPNIIPYDGESSNVVFDGLYHGENTEAVVQLNQAYAESDLTDTDEVVSAQYTGSGWEFEVQEDYELGDELPAHQ